MLHLSMTRRRKHFALHESRRHATHPYACNATGRIARANRSQRHGDVMETQAKIAAKTYRAPGERATSGPAGLYKT